MTQLTAGDSAPEFTLATAGGGVASLSEYIGKRVIVYFYPAAMTPGCTTEACDFRDSLSGLVAAGISVIGISPDPVDKLAEFAERDSLTFPLASDPGRETMERWGVIGEKVKNGVTVLGVIRSSFLVGVDGRVERVYRDVSPDGHVAQLRADLGL
jgi:peroxiredoxin Q/BCP